MPGAKRGRGSPTMGDRNPNRVLKYSLHKRKLENKKKEAEEKRLKQIKDWNINKEWQEKKKPALMKKLKEGSRKRRKLRKEGTICGCNRNFSNYIEKIKGETFLYCGLCHKPKEMLK